MTYVVLQIVVFILLAGALGFVAGWMFRGWGLDGSTRMADGYEREQREALLRDLNTARAERDEARSQMLMMRGESAGAARVPTTPVAARTAAPRVTSQGADDLKRIKGIGPKLEQVLHTMGVSRFEQIAAWSDAQVEEINTKLRFQGRIERDGWIEQARALARK